MNRNLPQCSLSVVSDADSEPVPGWGHTWDIFHDECSAGHRLYHECFSTWQGKPLALTEIAMVAVMSQLMEKPEWERKVFDDEIASKWEGEALAMPNFSLKMWKYCLAELRYKAGLFKESKIAIPIDFDSQVVYSDHAISAGIREELITAVGPLEDVPEQDKDWHPGSNKQVLDLVHPSLFPLVFGRTRVVRTGAVGLDNFMSYCGQGEVVTAYEHLVSEGSLLGSSFDDLWSKDYQWLPSEVAIKDDVRITSYINNLHPQDHKGLYRVIEKVIAKSLPLWDQLLKNTGKTREHKHEKRVNIENFSFEYPYGKKCPDGWEEGSSQDESGSWEDEEWQRETRVVVGPDPSDYKPPSNVSSNLLRDLPTYDLCKDYKDHGLQVIIKLANIHLDPNNPSYSGGSWHVEGQLNEHIVATSLFYYDQDNIGPSHLAFRQNIDADSEDLRYEQSDFAHLEQIMGIKNDVEVQQYLGQVSTKQGRLLAFPNVLQHRVPPFALEDSTKPGYRKILALFLVDPHQRIFSTANVPPQQHDWWARELCGNKQDTRFLRDLPSELMNNVIQYTDDFPMSLDEAKDIRTKLMAERSRKTTQALDQAATSFNFCEH